VLLPEIVSRSLLSLRGDAGANDPVFVSRKGGRLSERTVNDMMKRLRSLNALVHEARLRETGKSNVD
jgi:hypothetical protein